jgi:hypothetical protein
MHRQRLLLFLMSLAAAAATSALGQTVAPTVGPASTQGATYIPDFSGRWSHPYWPGFEPPASGPGPVTNRLRLREGPQKGVSNPNQLVGDYTNPILKPQAAEQVKIRRFAPGVPFVSIGLNFSSNHRISRGTLRLDRWVLDRTCSARLRGLTAIAPTRRSPRG